MKKLLCLTLVVTMLSSTLVFAEEDKTIELVDIQKEVSIIYDDGNGNFSFTSNESENERSTKGAIDKSAIEKYLEEYLEEKHLEDKSNGERNVRLTYLDSISNSNTSSYSDGNVKSSFASKLNVDSFPGYIVTINGTSKDFWTGTKPYNATSIDSSDSFYFTTFGISSLSLSYPVSAGVSFSTGSKSATISYPQIRNNYSYSHSYSGIKASTSVIGSITKASQTHANTFLFGNKSVSVATDDSTLVWEK